MNKLQQLLIGVRFMGLRTTLRTLSYSIYRDSVDRRFGKKPEKLAAPPLQPKILEAVKPFHNGAFFSFNDGLQLEVAFLSMRTARVTWRPGSLPANYAISGEETIALRVEIKEETDGWQLTAGGLRVQVSQEGSIQYHSKDLLIREDDPPEYHAPGWTHQATLAEEAAVYGLGERTQYNLRPGTYRFWNKDIGGSYGPGADPLYLTIPVYYCRQAKGSYLAFYENSFDGEAHFEDRAVLHFKGGALRLFMIDGTLPQAVEEYTRLTGRPQMPPRWSFGFHQSRWGYQSEQEVREVVAGFQEHDLPLAAIHLDIDYMDGYRVFTYDKKRFPNFAQMVADFNAQGVKVVMIIDPGVKDDPNYMVYANGLRANLFCTLPDGKAVRGLVWPGWVHFPDFTNPLTRAWWGLNYLQYLDMGVAGFWHDMNEPAVFAATGEKTLPLVTQHHLEGVGGDHREAHNLYGLTMNLAAFDAIRKFRPNKRVWLLTRSGWAGVQKYAWTWTADEESSWPALKMTVGMVLGLGISGIPYSGSDIGGFSGAPDAELFTRWFQMSALMAFFRNHAAVGTPRREPWVFGEPTVSICRSYLHLRERLIPYLYSLAWEAHQTGAPLARPLTWLDQEDAELATVEDAFLLGTDLLVAPVVEQGAVRRKVRLPRGAWFDFWEDTLYKGGQEIEVDAPLERMPIFARSGSVIPLQDGEVLTLHIYLPDDDWQEHLSQMFDDAGDGFEQSRVDTFILRRDRKTVTMSWRREGNYPLPEKISLVIHGAAPRRVRADSRDLGEGIAEFIVKKFSNLLIELK